MHKLIIYIIPCYFGIFQVEIALFIGLMTFLCWNRWCSDTLIPEQILYESAQLWKRCALVKAWMLRSKPVHLSSLIWWANGINLCWKMNVRLWIRVTRTRWVVRSYTFPNSQMIRNQICTSITGTVFSQITNIIWWPGPQQFSKWIFISNRAIFEAQHFEKFTLVITARRDSIN